MPEARPVFSLRATVYTVLAAVALLGTVSNVLLARETHALRVDAHRLSVAGRQQLLAERVAHDAWQLVGSTTPQGRSQARLRLRRSVAGMREAHAQLLRHGAAAQPPAPEAAPDWLDVQVQGYLAAASSILLTPDDRLSRRNADIRWLEEQATGPLLTALDQATVQMERRGDARIRHLSGLVWTCLGVGLALLLALALLVFRPLERRHRRILADLARERDFGRQVMGTVAQGLTVTDAAGRFVYVNPAYARLLGTAPEALLGRTPRDVTFEEDHPVLVAPLAHAEGQTRAYEARLKRADGTLVPVLVTDAPRAAEGGAPGTITAITDLTERKQAEQTVATLAALSRGLEAEHTPAEVARRALAILSGAVEVAWLVLFVLRGERFVPEMYSGPLPPGLREQMDAGLGRGEGAIWETLSGEPVYLEQTRVPAYLAHGVQAVALVPLPGGSRGVTRVLGVYRAGSGRAWTPRERLLLAAAVQSLAAALERAELYEEARQAAAYAQALVAVSALVESRFDPLEVAQQVFRILAPILEVDWGGLILVRGDQARVITTWPPEAARAEDRLTGELLGGLPWRQTGQTCYIDDYSAQPGAAAPLVRAGVRALAWGPLAELDEGRFVVVVTRLGQVQPWSGPHRDLFEAAARTLRLALERQRHLRRVERAAVTDNLTGLGNRRAFERHLEELAEQDPGEGPPFGVIYVDMDGLKQINDTWGHSWGDRVLREFGQALGEVFRDQDRVYRLGGDEYAVLLPGASAEHAPTLLARVQQAAARMRPLPGQVGPGASAGAAFWPQDGERPAEVVSVADQRMYQEKQRRRPGQGNRALPA
ncbi:sensor domain-containing diguanylate cyclase (plasmid) [Deinococcus metallilatus]|uniref:Diguanylate cyclase n=1 Tax=Deinococcus metallilatus TaxID=1211322 RepID=A0AAJ5F9N6_9DEIO|nr:sensor domain-containing diguanylate cyclase [Deinococcus metallilatus]MBB5293307.1 diguanylate cyclase (GGDEF)-like protein/PAS domain S-box-containing protein [Deinococcus metallilatus]QBY06417.1 sensor domain-containing diguanylate cyclase [Deinococcus metallilatus]RXJ18096.1 sensor domain-containing diguanylate cyclase [Deinococcus metallilatus]TLK32032.1 diguanylate cyclase [Deinococcus metallilatus]GMA15470.1 hypothetical protein GCM10025871_18010 [Deinococcus metallilatus]